jgi:hypothetical protein
VKVVPLTAGSGLSSVMVVTVATGGGGGAADTVCGSVSVLPLSPGPPLYVAVRVLSPTVVSASGQLPAELDSEPVQL